MKSNSNSQSSSLEDIRERTQSRTKRRLRKQIFKEKDGSQNENEGSILSNSVNESRDDQEEDKSGGLTPYSGYKKRSTFIIDSDSNEKEPLRNKNGYWSGDDSSNHSPKRKSKKKSSRDHSNDVKSSSSWKGKNKHVKLKVKKIDEEGVSPFLYRFDTNL